MSWSSERQERRKKERNCVGFVHYADGHACHSGSSAFSMNQRSEHI